MSQTFEQYLRERRERAIDDGHVRPRPRAFASNARYIVGEGRTRDELQVTGVLQELRSCVARGTPSRSPWLATDRPVEVRA